MSTATLETTVTRSALLDGLARVGLVIPRGKASLPVATMVRIAGARGGLRLTGTDFDRTVTTLVAAEGDEFPARVVPFTRLAAIVNQLPVGPIEITPTKNGVRLVAQRARFEVVGLPADEFPRDAVHDDASASITIDAPDFVTALTRAATHCSDAVSRPTLNGVHVQAKKNGHLAIEGTDGSRMAVEHVERTKGPALDIIIPSWSVFVIAKLFADAERITLDLRGTRAVIAGDGDGLVFDTSLLEGPFPETGHVLNQSLPYSASVDRLALLTAVRRVAALSSEKMFRVALDWAADRVTVSGTGDEDAGTSEDSVSCALASGDPIRILFMPRYLIDALALRTTDTVTVGLKNATTAMSLRDEGALSAQGLVMPLREMGK